MTSTFNEENTEKRDRHFIPTMRSVGLRLARLTIWLAKKMGLNRSSKPSGNNDRVSIKIWGL
jgi:hypothetical protein